MPELPEVETIRRQLEPALVGASITTGWAFPSAKFSDAPLAAGAEVRSVCRRGKYLLLDLAGPEPTGARELVVHLGMTGRLSLSGNRDVDPGSWARSTLAPDDGSAAASPHLRACWDLDDSRTLLFHDVRRFGRIAVVAAGDHQRLPTLAALGPEPFDDAFSPVWLRDRVNESSRAVKTQLLSQRVVAGVGNIYADEALWRAQVHPGSRRLTRAAAAALCESIRQALVDGLRNGGTTLRDYRDARGGTGGNQRFLDCYGRAGEPCARCGTELRRTVIDARSTTFCPECQRRSR